MPSTCTRRSPTAACRRAASASAARSCGFERLDVMVALGLAGLVNMAMLAVAATLFHTPAYAGVSTIEQAHQGFARLVGGGAALAFAVALLASGVSSSSVGTYAGQVVMAGFVNLRVPLLLRRAVTMVPALRPARPRREPHLRPRAQPGRALLRHPLRARAAGAADEQPGDHARARQQPPRGEHWPGRSPASSSLSTSTCWRPSSWASRRPLRPAAPPAGVATRCTGSVR